MKPTQAKWWVKCLGFTLSVDVLLGVVMFLYAREILTNVQSLLLFLAISVVGSPLYFFVKSNATFTPLYISVTAASHILWIVAIIWGLCKVFPGWEALMFWFTGGTSAVLLALILLMDAVIWVWHKIFK